MRRISMNLRLILYEKEENKFENSNIDKHLSTLGWLICEMEEWEKDENTTDLAPLSKKNN